jgi:hypothetical protein
MVELLRTNDLVFLSFLTAALKAEGVETLVFDAAMSATEGSIIAIPRRLMVAAADEGHAKAVLANVRAAYPD